ncbi:MAG TPA: GDP-mannose 4,6-dehydratase [Gemmatimonadaceae bacterium]|nr:GDP-mannose 4,6-dehydratase [Gemmatimonadaceae bacterium]
MSRRALVTGAAGFVGQWVGRELVERGWDVSGTCLEDAPPVAAPNDPLASVRWHVADVRRPEDLGGLLDTTKPDAILHLAGVAFVPAAQADPGAALDVNVGAAARLLADLKRRRAAGTLDPVVLVIGSGEQYGRHEAGEMPLAESAEQRPHSVYAASKAAQELVALEAFRSSGVRVLATRSFNHSGAGQADRYVLPALVRRALALRSSGQRALPIGNTTTVRDFLHVRDVARAYVDLVTRGTAGDVYNVASGVGVDVGTLAQRVLALVRVDAILNTDAALVRPAEVPVLVGDATKLRRATDWSPQFTLDSIIEDLIRAAAS